MEKGPSPEKIIALNKRMAQLNIRQRDIEEKFIKAGGRGGQKVNKTSAAVFLKHRPTGICVKCQASRLQSLNRFLALRRLVEKIESDVHGIPSKETARIERIKKQKKRRKRKNANKNT